MATIWNHRFLEQSNFCPKRLVKLVFCWLLFVSYLFRVGCSTDIMYSTLIVPAMGKRQNVSRPNVHTVEFRYRVPSPGLIDLFRMSAPVRPGARYMHTGQLHAQPAAVRPGHGSMHFLASFGPFASCFICSKSATSVNFFLWLCFGTPLLSFGYLQRYLSFRKCPVRKQASKNEKKKKKKKKKKKFSSLLCSLREARSIRPSNAPPEPRQPDLAMVEAQIKSA